MKNLLKLVCGIVLGISLVANGQIKPVGLRCEYRTNPFGIDVVQPRLSWVLESDQRGQKQNAYLARLPVRNML